MADATATTPARRGRPVSEEKRTAILRAATEHFLRDGYEGTGLDAVAATAGVSKQTVYRHFTDKDTLFRAVIAAARAPRGTAPATGARLVDATDLRGSLARLGSALLAVTLDERVAALRRLMIGELGRRPELHDMWVAAEPRAFGERLAAEFEELAAAGVIEVPDAHTAVLHLLSLLTHPANVLSRYGLDPLGEPDRERIAAAAADMFVRAYAARKNCP